MREWGMPKRPRDVNQLAKAIVEIATGETQDTVSPNMRRPFSRKARLGGSTIAVK